MSVLTILILIFALLGALDRILGNRFGLGAEFARGFSIFGVSALSSMGILILAPAIGIWLTPAAQGFYALFGIDPSVIPASLFANDMGGTTLSLALAKTPSIGLYNAFIVSTMMGCTISYTIPKGYHSGSGKVQIVLETKTVTPTKSAQDITPTSGKVLGKVTVAAIPASRSAGAGAR